jgi:rhamnogalacturonyl hydrolase YesR
MIMLLINLKRSKALSRTGLVCMLTMGFLISCSNPVSDTGEADLDAIAEQLLLLDKNVQDELVKSPLDDRGREKAVPRSINDDGSLSVVTTGDWTSGFYPGVLWYMYEMTGDELWKDKAIEYTGKLEKEQFNGSNHDVGFRMFCSYGNGLRLTGDESYIPILVQSAKTLIARYYESIGCIRSWDHNRDKWQCPVIIDNMMNLELLFWASEQTGDPIYHDIAVQHAVTTLENHFRSDNSSVHVVDYDTITGEVRKKNTHQGYADESSWARGQAWGLYGYTMTYRCTKDPRFLRQAENIAGFLLTHPNMPEDMAPYWDFNAPGIPDEPRDVSAAAIIASALYELSTLSEKGDLYRAGADEIMKSLVSEYMSPPGENYGFILDHSVGNLPNDDEVDVPLNYAEYYFLEALYRKGKLDI